MTHTLIPRSSACSAKVVASLDFEKYWSCDIINSYVKSGFTVAAQCPAALAVDVTTGVSRVLGLYVENTVADTVTSLTACAVNSIYLTIDRDCCCRPSGWSYSKNTTGVVPTDSMLMSTATTNCATVTAVCNTIRQSRPINLGIAGDQVYPINTTIGCYVQPCTAVATSESVTLELCDPLTGNCNWNECNIGCDISYSACCDRYDFNAAGAGENEDWVFHDVGELHDRMIAKGKFRFSTITACQTQNTRIVVLLSTVNTDFDCTTGDWVGFTITATACGQSSNASVSNDGTYNTGATISNFCCFPSATCTDYFWKIDWDSIANCLTVSYYTAACCACLIESQSVCTGEATLAGGVRYLMLGTRTSATNANTLAGFHDDIRIETPCFPAINAVDCCCTSKWKSTCENNPAIYMDTGAVKELPSIALNICKTDTTETEIKIRTSTDTCFTDCETIRIINVSDFTDDTDRFITLPRTLDDRRYIQILGTSNSKVLSINEMKYDTQTAAVINKGHFHKLLSSSSTADNSLDSD